MAKIRNATATTPDQVGSTEVGRKVVLEERFGTFLTNKGNTRRLEENSTSNQLSNLDELLVNLQGQKNISNDFWFMKKKYLDWNWQLIEWIIIQQYYRRTRWHLRNQLNFPSIKRVIYVVKDLGWLLVSKNNWSVSNN